MDARQRILVGQEPSAEQKPAAEKLVKLMQERLSDGSYMEKAKKLHEAILADLDS